MCRRHSATSALGVPVGGIDNGEIFRRQIEVMQPVYLRGIEIEHRLQVLEFSGREAQPPTCSASTCRWSSAMPSSLP